jgi:hypothetical protein
VDFEVQLIDFVRHLQLLMYDDTFPIWIMTTTSGAAAAKSPKDDDTNLNCHEERKYPRTTDHPCK